MVCFGRECFIAELTNVSQKTTPGMPKSLQFLFFGKECFIAELTNVSQKTTPDMPKSLHFLGFLARSVLLQN